MILHKSMLGGCENQQCIMRNRIVNHQTILVKDIPIECFIQNKQLQGVILCVRPANEGRWYIVTSSLICWVYTQMIPELS